MKDHLIRDEIEDCPYLPGRVARMPLYAPTFNSSGPDTDQRLASGQRRAGEFVYQTDCPACQACIPMRIDVGDFSVSSSQQRVLRRGDRELEMRIAELRVDRQRVDLFNKHRRVRGLGRDRDAIDLEDYQWGFVRSCFDSFEMSYTLDGRLVAVAICDYGSQSLSAVYTFYDPDVARQSLGTYSILKQLEYCRDYGYRFLYLGFYISECRAMSYKSRFRPNQRLLDGKWLEFV